MLSAEVLRQACEPMALNGGLAAREADHSSPFGSYLSSSSSGSFGSDAGGGLFGARGSTASGPRNDSISIVNSFIHHAMPSQPFKWLDERELKNRNR
ncbi:unnamed protein product, partial [Mesorhabditis belari]|uniref:Uncharacterized protein n=1 Tax=Mesorhabditis belari TaxID=2138241 RepID=A0AAF3FBT8_9BILA